MTESEEDKTDATIAGWVYSIVVLASLPWWALVTATLWNWFVVPTFGLPTLNFAVAGGLRVLIAVLVTKISPAGDKTALWYYQSALNAVLLPAVLLLTGWLYRLFI